VCEQRIYSYKKWVENNIFACHIDELSVKTRAEKNIMPDLMNEEGKILHYFQHSHC